MRFRCDKSSIEAVLFSLVMYQRMHTNAKKSHITMRVLERKIIFWEHIRVQCVF